MEIRVVRRIGSLLAAIIFGVANGSPTSAQTLVAGGTGAGLGFLQKVGEAASRDDASLKIRVLPSMGSAGGVRALVENVLSVAVVGRALTKDEISSGASEAICFLTPFVFVTSTPGVSGITRSELLSYYGGDRPTWRTGAPVRVLLRPVTDVATPFLADMIPGMADAQARARTRREMLITATDQENVELATSVSDSLTGATLVQLISDAVPLTRLTLDGVEPTVERMVTGAYPRGLTLCVAVGPARTDAALRLVEWLRKPEREAFYASLGLVRK